MKLDYMEQVGVVIFSVATLLAVLGLSRRLRKFLGFDLLGPLTPYLPYNHHDTQDILGIPEEASRKDILAKLDEQCPPILYSNRAHMELILEEIQDAEDIKALEEGSYATSSECNSEHSICSICLGEFEGNDFVRRLPCSHLFHQDCVDQWLVPRKTDWNQFSPNFPSPKKCPLCREDVLADQQIVQEELVKILGVWARSDGRIVATIDRRHIVWYRNCQESFFTLRDKVIKIHLNRRTFTGIVGDGQINWCDGDKWQILSAEETNLRLRPQQTYRTPFQRQDPTIQRHSISEPTLVLGNAEGDVVHSLPHVVDEADTINETEMINYLRFVLPVARIGHPMTRISQ